MSSTVVRSLAALCFVGALAACGDETGDTTGAGGSGASGTTSGTTDTTATGTGGGDTTSSTTGTGGGGTCPAPTTCDATIAAFQACGGDVKGTWTIKEFCQKPALSDPDPDCPNGKISGFVAGGTGEISFDGANLTLTVKTADQRIHIESPQSCLPPQVTCAQYEQALSQQIGTVCCEDQAGVCVCDAQQISMTENTNSQSYTTMGNTITIGPEQGEYCVKDGMLWLHTGIGEKSETVMVFETK